MTDQLDLLRCRAQLVAVRGALQLGLQPDGTWKDPAELLDAIELLATGAGSPEWPTERTAKARALGTKMRRQAEQRAKETGICPCCNGKATHFDKRRCPGESTARWTWSCPEGCNP